MMGMEKIVEQLQVICSGKGIDYWDGYMEENQQVTVDLGGESGYKQNERIEAGIGIRIFKNQQLAFYAVSNPQELSIQSITDLNRLLDEDYFPKRIPPPSIQHSYVDAAKLNIYDPYIEKMTLQDRLNYLHHAEEIYKQSNSRNMWILTHKLTTHQTKTTYFNSLGSYQSYKSTLAALLLAEIAATNGHYGFGYGGIIARYLSDLNVQKVGSKVEKQIDIKLNGTGISEGKYHVIISPEITANVLTQLGEMLKADHYLSKQSLLTGQLQEKIANACVNLTNNGLLLKGNGTIPFDGEGVPVGKQELIREGYLTNLLHDTYTAQRIGVRTSGAAKRYNFRTQPIIGWTNLELETGVKSEKELISSIDYGIYLTNILNFGRVNYITGKFEVNSLGYLIENGQLTKPLKSLYFMGNIGNILDNIEAVSNQPEWVGTEGNIYTPALLLTDQYITC